MYRCRMEAHYSSEFSLNDRHFYYVTGNSQSRIRLENQRIEVMRNTKSTV